MIEKNLRTTIKEMLFWYARENRIIFLPFHAFLLLLWIGSRKLFLKKQITNRNEKPVIAFTSVYFNGNARAVYEYMLKNLKDKYSCYWIARNKITFDYLRKLKKPTIYMYFPFTALREVLTTSLLVTNDSYLQFLFPKRIKMVQLWHGVGPKGSIFRLDDLKDAWCFSSEYVKRRFMENWGFPPEKLYVTGFARMDTLCRYLEMPKEKLLEELGIRDGRKIVLYAPTFDVGLWPWGNAYEGIEKLCRFCKKNNLILIVRVHPLAKINRKRLRRIVSGFENVYWIDAAKEPDTMKILSIADILITDWSSIYTDYFLTKRPIIYMEVDPHFFVKKRGMGDIPPEFRAGEIVHNEEELYKALNMVLKEGNRYRERQCELLQISHGKVDGKASERVVKVIDRLLERD